jgi:hypothetical protein
MPAKELLGIRRRKPERLYLALYPTRISTMIKEAEHNRKGVPTCEAKLFRISHIVQDSRMEFMSVESTGRAR